MGMLPPDPPIGRHGGHPALDFVNTISRWSVPKGVDYLADYPAVLAWVRWVGLVDDLGARDLLAAARAEPAQATHFHAAVLSLRQNFSAVLSALVDETPLQDALDTLAKGLEAVRRPRLMAGTAISTAPHQDDPLSFPLEVVAASVTGLLLSPDLVQLRRCESRDCGWYFLDRSRTTPRRWCSMKGCGNREKARRHQARASGD